MIRIASTLALLLCLSVGIACAKDVSGLYDAATLEQWKARYEVSTKRILDQVIWPVLTAQEKQQLAGARLDFPLYSEIDKANPLSFYAPGDGRVVMPVLSLKFLDDLCTDVCVAADQWLRAGDDLRIHRDARVQGFPFGALSAAAAGAAYPAQCVAGSPGRRTRARPFRDGAHVPASPRARSHLLPAYLGHDRAIASERGAGGSIRGERDAPDAAATERQPGVLHGRCPLVGVSVGYTDAQWQEHLKRTGTHPLTGQRLHTLARQIRERDLASFMDQLATMLDDPDVQAGIIATAKASDESMLAPRRPGELPRLVAAQTPSQAGRHPAFDGTFLGKFTQGGEADAFRSKPSSNVAGTKSPDDIASGWVSASSRASSKAIRSTCAGRGAATTGARRCALPRTTPDFRERGAIGSHRRTPEPGRDSEDDRRRSCGRRAHR